MLPRPWCGPCFQPFGVCSWEGIASPMTIPGLIFEDLPILFMNLLLLWGLFDGLEPRKGSRGRDALAGSPWGSPPRAPGYVLVGVCFPVGGSCSLGPGVWGHLLWRKEGAVGEGDFLTPCDHCVHSWVTGVKRSTWI